MKLADIYNVTHLLLWDNKILENTINKIVDINLKAQIENVKNIISIPNRESYLKYLK